MSLRASETPQPPQPPPLERRLRFYPLQLVGVPLLALLPLLSLLGVFGVSRGAARAEAGGLELRVAYPSKLRYGLEAALSVTVTNLSDQAAPVTVFFDKAYLESFANLSFAPAVSAIGETAYQVELGELASGASRAVTLELQADHYWRRRGAVWASSLAGEARVPLTTVVYP